MTNNSLILVPTSLGELLDKITILKIKSERITDRARLENVKKELHLLEEIRQKSFSANHESLGIMLKLEGELKKSNENLWDLEDSIRELDKKKDFGEEFIRVARSIYVANDRRASIKKEINIMIGSALVEEKSYKD